MTDQLEFIQMQIYPNFSKCLYQYFDDAEKKDPTLTCKGKFITEQCFWVLEEANKKGAGIFFSVNWFDEEDRKKDKVTTINAWICDIDGIDKEFQKQLIELCPLKPSLIVESKNWFHLYRFANDGTKENREKICCGVRNFFDGDPNAITIERVLRLPWFEHCKDPNNRFLCKIYDYNGATYTEEQMLAKYPNTKSVKDKKEEIQTMKFETKKDDGDFRERVWSFDTKQMLQMLSRTKFMPDDIDFKTNSNWTEQIFCNGKSTACWIDKNWLIGSKTGWWPTWIQWIKWYGDIDWKDLYKRLIEKFPDLKKKEEVKKTKNQEKEIEWDFLVEYNRKYESDYISPIPYTWGTEWLDNMFGKVAKWMFLTTIWESGSWKTTFAFNQWIEIARNHKVLFVSLEMSGERVIDIRSRKMSWITIQEWNEKRIPQPKIDYMEKMKKQIFDNKNLNIVWVNKDIEDKTVHIDKILNTVKNKYSDYDWIIIDNLWYIQDDWENDIKKLNSIIRKIKWFCWDTGITINLLHHFNKGKSWSTGNRLERTFSDVMGTAKLEHDIDYGIFISRNSIDDPENFTPQDKAEVFIKLAKDRERGNTIKKVVYFQKWSYNDSFNS